MMSGKHGVGQSITALVTVVTRRALTGQCRVINAALHDLLGLTKGHAMPSGQRKARTV